MRSESVSLARKGDERGFAGLVRLHQRRAYMVARSIVITHEDAEEYGAGGIPATYGARPVRPSAGLTDAWAE